MLTEPERAKGLRKFIPQPDRFAERYGHFTLTARDLTILDLVYRYRYVEARHVRTLIDGSEQQITRRLQGLFHNGYLGRYARRERMRLELDPGAPMIAYGLETKGARVLQRLRGSATTSGSSNAPIRWKKEYTRRTEWFLEHHLMVSTFRCVLESSVQRMEHTELVRWTQGLATWFSVTARGRVMRVAPDAHFAVRVGDEEVEFFLEADRGTETHRRILDKFVAYWWYLQRDREPARRTTVLFLTNSIERAQRLEEALRRMPKPNRSRHGGKGVFVFLHEPPIGTAPRELMRGLRLAPV